MTTATLTRLPTEVVGDWQRLARPTTDPRRFGPDLVAGLPAPVRRWLTRTIRPGAPVLEAAELTTHGEIRIGRWRRFEARQVLRPPEGFVWTGTAHLGPLPIIGFDRYVDGAGEMCWRLLGRVPVQEADGPDVSRSAAGRLAGETVLMPTAALSPAVRWRLDDGDDRHAVADVDVDAWPHTVVVRVAPSGLLEASWMQRWGDPDGTGLRERTFGCELTGELDVGDYLLPARISAGWGFGTADWPDGEFFRAELDWADLR